MAEAAREPENLEQLLERIEQADDDAGGRVSVGALLDAVGHRSFGAILLAAGLFTVLPGPADIPGVPTLVGVLVLLVSGQILLRQDHVWLPDWVLRRSISKRTLEKGREKLERPARFVDRLVRPRLVWVVRGPGAHVLAFGCVVVALGFPFTEVVPFSANLGGGALALYALALIARDGVVGLVAHAVTLAAVGIVLRGLL